MKVPLTFEIKFILSVITCMLSFKGLYSQSYYFNHYTVEKGLSSNTVLSSVQDDKGFLWFGTVDGLNRFDGNNFKVFRLGNDTQGDLQPTGIISLCKDTSGNIWAGTDKGLYYFNAITEALILVRSTSGKGITNLCSDKHGQIWFMSESKIYRFKPSRNSLLVIDSKSNLDASSLCISADGIPWIGTSTGLLRKLNIENKTFQSFDVFVKSKDTRSRNIPKLYDTGKGCILVGTSNHGVKLFDLKTMTYRDILTKIFNNSKIYVREFLHYSGDEYWIATEVGLFIYNLKTAKSKHLTRDYNDPYSISDNAVYALCKDKEGGIWVGSFFGGLDYYSEQNSFFEKFFPSQRKGSISGSVVREICKDHSGTMWIGTEDASVNRFDPITSKFTQVSGKGGKHELSYTNIQALHTLRNELWVGTFEHGLDVLHIESGNVIRRYQHRNDTNALKSNFVTTMLKASKGRFYIGSSNGLYKYVKAKDSFHQILLKPATSPFIHSLMEDSRKNLWVGTLTNGVYLIRADTKEPNQVTFKFKGRKRKAIRANSFYESDSGVIWLTTDGEGLLKLNLNNTVKRYTTKNEFPSNFIFKVLEDSEKMLWISTSKGLVHFNPFTEKLEVYTKDNGLLSDQFNYSSGYYDAPSNLMYFGSVKGLIRFNPKLVKLSSYVPPVYITSLKVDNRDLAINGTSLKKAIHLSDKVVLTNKQSSFTVQFSALSFTAPDMIKYEYKLDGPDKPSGWIQANKEANFTRLPAGTYNLHVKAMNSSGLWSPETILVISILPPFWRSPLLVYVYIISAVGLSFTIIKHYSNQIKERNQRRIEIASHNKEKEIYKAKLDFFTNVAHDIRTPLTLIKGPMEKIINRVEEFPLLRKNLEIMNKNTDRLLQLADQLLDFKKHELYSFSLNFEPIDIPDLLNELHLSFQPAIDQKEITVEIVLPDTLIAAVDKEAFLKIMTNLYSNAIKYCSNYILITLKESDPAEGWFSIKIKSNGQLIPQDSAYKIFDLFYRSKSGGTEIGAGLGLTISKALAELMKGSLKLGPVEDNMNVFILELRTNQL